VTRFVVHNLVALPEAELKPLLKESRTQGFEFVDRLAAEYANGTNLFDGPGEALFGVIYDGSLVAIGGLNRDPYARDDHTGRVRRVYVLDEWRSQGVGRLLVERIIAEARQHFRLLTLRTLSEQADGFYRALGFRTEPKRDGATHHMVLE